MFFPLLYSQHTCQTTYILSYTTKTMSKVQSEHTQSLHYKNIRQFFTCLNCIPPVKFNFGLPSIMCHFLVNNLHFITYSNCIVWPHWKKFTYTTNIEFSTQFSHIWLFLRIKVTWSYLGLNPIACEFLVKQPAFYHVFHSKRAKSRSATTNQRALFEILSISLVQCIFT